MKISAYVNCSMGGMGTVLRNRALGDADTKHALYFVKDAGGTQSFSKLNNVELRIIQRDRLAVHLIHAANVLSPEEISVTSMPDVAVALWKAGKIGQMVYEIHTSDSNVISRELEILAAVQRVRIRVPSKFTADQVLSLKPDDLELDFEIVPNTVDSSLFQEDGGCATFPERVIPLIWVGRLDKGKNPNDLLRLLKQLPDVFAATMVISLEAGPDRLTEFLGLSAQYGVLDRISVRSDISQAAMAELLRGARDCGGVFVSTSLAESFGYSILEAALCGIPTIAYEVGAVGEHSHPIIELVPPGGLKELSEAVARSVERRLGSDFARGPQVRCAP